MGDLDPIGWPEESGGVPVVAFTEAERRIRDEAIATANDNGESVARLARRLGTTERSIYRSLSRARRTREQAQP